ncbi:hypothetical protein LOCC1_G007472 [Lachnellula occidentalis]|uniref:Uncharacterized protein n=1 Tax=Lachnellula occidentalis TaxID=215460 RepID=A0A8H8UG21_9HELO|nr:hypothetical protein LOCC1_G007472 [Lachnellula occidentalis]
MPALHKSTVAANMTNFRLVAPAEAHRVLAGTIMFLPPKDKIPKGAWTDPELLDGAFNHPVAIVSCPQPKEMQHTTHVEIAIMTSFHGSTVKAHLAAKGIHTASGTLAAERSGHLRVVTASKPYAKDVLKLRDGMGMKRDSCYVGIRRTYAVELKVLARYGFGREEVDGYRLTAFCVGEVGGECEGEGGGEGEGTWEGRRRR